MAKKNSHPVNGWDKEKEQILRYLPNLKAYAVKLCRDGVRAEDLVQETVLRALTNINTFEKGTNLHAWLTVILHNLFRSEWRKQRREVEDADGAYAKTLKVQPDAEASNELDRLAMSIACLPRDQADAVMLVGYLGYSYETAAEFMGCAVGTIKSRVNRARDTLAELMVSGEFVRVDVEPLKHATRGVPRTHSYYPLARAYEEMFEGTYSVGIPKGNGKHQSISTEEDELWNEIVRTGALDEVQESDPNWHDAGFELK